MNSLFSCLLTYLMMYEMRWEDVFMREVVVYGNRNYFYWAVAFWKDEISDEKHEEIPRSSDSLFAKNPKVFELQLFFSKTQSARKKKRKSKITGTPAETVDISSVVRRSLRDRSVSLIVTEESVQLWANFQRWFVRINYNKKAVLVIHHFYVLQ